MVINKLFKTGLGVVLLMPSLFTISCFQNSNIIAHYKMNNNMAYQKVFSIKNNKTIPDQEFSLLPFLKEKNQQNDFASTKDSNSQLKQLKLDNEDNYLQINTSKYVLENEYTYNGSSLSINHYNNLDNDYKYKYQYEENQKAQFAYDYLASKYQISAFSGKNKDEIYDFSKINIRTNFNNTKYYFNQSYDAQELFLNSNQEIKYMFESRQDSSSTDLYDYNLKLNINTLNYFLESEGISIKNNEIIINVDERIFLSSIIKVLDLGLIDKPIDVTSILKALNKVNNINLSEKDVKIEIDETHNKAKITGLGKYKGVVEVSYKVNEIIDINNLIKIKELREINISGEKITNEELWTAIQKINKDTIEPLTLEDVKITGIDDNQTKATISANNTKKYKGTLDVTFSVVSKNQESKLIKQEENEDIPTSSKSVVEYRLNKIFYFFNNYESFGFRLTEKNNENEIYSANFIKKFLIDDVLVSKIKIIKTFNIQPEVEGEE
ncbi:hypothetical protein SHELI_v1c05920 [Spiroplasma helicoides]|uniref:Lipoprotein n=1 Tax=Spiroplasma helicoides TaxID=216938 RepID=A0A1B3SKU6_9MOLU|nr:hypothetical protein [Spiroplasma helicoides]AOG60543.1 hypothetical protein SHELI_v1c05920 [Spiroplasma helicoides]